MGVEMMAQYAMSFFEPRHQPMAPVFICGYQGAFLEENEARLATRKRSHSFSHCSHNVNAYQVCSQEPGECQMRGRPGSVQAPSLYLWSGQQEQAPASAEHDD